jgi:hypothetical protein
MLNGTRAPACGFDRAVFGLRALTIRRLVLRPCLLAMAATAIPAVAASPPLYAVVIGIDNYRHLPRLDGAVNDAKAIAQSLQKAGARETRVLIDDQATRAAIISAITAMGRRAGAENGWLVISYAGHGGQERERQIGDEADGKDEVLLLGGFDPGPAGNGERLVDNDIYTLLAAVPKNVQILFVADACHSGTMTRSLDSRRSKLGTRLATYGPIIADTLPAPPKASIRKEGQDLPNVVFVASARDNEVTPEIYIDDIAHGAVSWNMARAFDGDADQDRNGVTDLSELRQFVMTAVGLMAENLQTPAVRFLPGRERDALPAVGGTPAAGRVADEVITRIFVIGGKALPDLPNARATTSRETADLVWDTAAGDIVANATGDKIVEQTPGQADGLFLSGVVQKLRALALLRIAVTRQPLPIAIGPNGAGTRYAEGVVDVSMVVPVQGGARFMTVYNIAGDGTVQLLYPDRRKPAERNARPPGTVISFSNRVQRPFGADHIVALSSTEAPTDLWQKLTAIDGLAAPLEAAEIVLAARDEASTVGLVGIFSGPE